LILNNYINNRSTYTPVQSPLPRIISTEPLGYRRANASTLNETTERAAIKTDIRQIKVLRKQASSAIPKAVNDGDMTTEDATALGNLLEQSTDELTSDGLTPSVAFLTTACAMFN
jgi:hypothetical protein